MAAHSQPPPSGIAPRKGQLDDFYREVRDVILQKQHPISGLLPASTAVTHHGNYRDAWVRDNVYSILAVWGLSIAYRSVDAERGRRYELEQRTIALMRGLLRAMMAQSKKVEVFKQTGQPKDALHAKYDTATGGIVVGDLAWGHLQIDATSIYLLTMAQMIRSGLSVIGTQDEVNFVQNLVYYIERAYCTPDYGIWERGDKSNRGRAELNASSLGMATAALEAMSGFNLFGAYGSQESVIHVNPDAIALSNITLSSMLPRESNTKETDAALLSIVGYPAFAVADPELAARVRTEVVDKLQGEYGLKRFLLDGHQTPLEDEGRLHYERAELQAFEHIESEWPLFLTYLYLDASLRGDTAEVAEYERRLAAVTIYEGGHYLLPELYSVPAERVEAEKRAPGTQPRRANDNIPLVWAQSLYLLGRMVRQGVLNPGDIDPLTRRSRKVRVHPTVQLVFVAEDEQLQAELLAHGVVTETPASVDPVELYLPEDLANAFEEVGRNDGLGLSGRLLRSLKSLTTSRLYRLAGRTTACIAAYFVQRDSFLAYDLDFVVQRFESEIVYLHNHWTEVGRPTVTVLLTRSLLQTDCSPFYALMSRIEEGEVRGVPVRRGSMQELMLTASFERIDELNDFEGPSVSAVQRLSGSTALPAAGAQTPLNSARELEIEAAADSASLVAQLRMTKSVYEQVELLAALLHLERPSFTVEMPEGVHSLRELLQEVYETAGQMRLWAVLRRAAGLLGKLELDVGSAVTAILVRNKQIQVGRAYTDESIISTPLPDEELLERIAFFGREDVRDRVLTQELLIYASVLIKARPQLFSEMPILRIGHMALLMSSQLARERQVSAGEAYEHLMQLAPSLVQQRLEVVLEQYGVLESLPQQLENLDAECAEELTALGDTPTRRSEPPQPEGGWLEWRRHNGIVDRRAQDFYHGVWHVFRHTEGLIIGDKLERRSVMDSATVLSDTTSGEQAFAMWLERLLSRIQAPEYRQLKVEALNALSSFFVRNPTLRIRDFIALDAVIGHAVRLAHVSRFPEHESDYNNHKGDAWNGFYLLPPDRTSEYLVQALHSLIQLRVA